MKEVTGQVHATMVKAECYGGRRVHLRIDGLPGWLLSIISEVGPFRMEAASFLGGVPGPTSLMFTSAMVLAATEPASYQVPKEETPPRQSEEPKGGG